MSSGSRVRRTRAETSALPTINVGTEAQDTLREEFHRKCDISYVSPDRLRLPAKLAMKHYLASLVVYGGILLLYTINPWFRGMLTGKGIHGCTAMTGYYYAFAIYLVVSPIVLLLLRPRSVWVSKNAMIVGYFKRLLQWPFLSASERARRDLKPAYEEKHVLMFLLLKIIYGPLMVVGVIEAYNNIASVVQGMHKLPAGIPLVYWFDASYELFFYVIFLIDPGISAFAYYSESGWLGNKLRCTDTRISHALVCLACYPPFNLATVAIFGPSYRTPMIQWGGDVMHPLTWILRGLTALALLFMLTTGLCLGPKATNLTNRGIVTWGPYRLMRHPGYLSKNLFWLFTLIPFFVPNTAAQGFTWPMHLLFCAMLVAGYIGWGSLYFLRATTEEKFLMQDPDYVAYCRKVRYRFIPGVY